MFDIGSSELLLVAIVAIIVIGPKDLPRALYKMGQIVGKARGMARHFRTGLDAMVREAEMEELEKKWAAENQRIMKQWPTEDVAVEPAKALAAPVEGEVELSGDESAADETSSVPEDVRMPAIKDGPAA